MTCIVGVVDDAGGVWIGGDRSAVGTDWSISTVADPKVFRRGDFVFGVAGSFRLMDLLRYVFEPPAFDGSDPRAWMVSAFIPALASSLARSVSLEAKDPALRLPGPFLVGFEGSVFAVEGDLQVRRDLIGVAVGTGMVAALASLWTTERYEIKARDRVCLAVEAAAYCMGTVRGPVDVVSIAP